MNIVVSHWSADVAVLAIAALITAVHLAGLRGLAADAKRDGHDRPAGLGREAVAWYAGLAVAVLALVSPLGYWSYRLIWIRSLQDLLLTVVAPPLIVLGAPWLVLWRGLGRSAPPAEREPGYAAPHWLSWPVAVTAGFTVVWWGWHLPALYDGALHHPVVYAAEVLMYLAVGVVFWLQLIGSRPFSPRLPPLYRVMLIAATVLTSTILAMVLGFGANVIYPGYLAPAGGHRPSVVGDQQVGGAEIWVLVLLPYIITGISLLVRWLNDEESRALASGLDRMLQPPKSAWPSRTGFR